MFGSTASAQSQINLAGSSVISHRDTKIFTVFLQLAIGLFTICLVWFSFVFYPRIVDRYKGVGLPQKNGIPDASASDGFPIETAEYRVVYEQGSNTYYAFIQGKNIADFVDNKNRASLALKNSLSLESVCNLNVIFVSSEQLEIPQDYKNPASCR